MESRVLFSMIRDMNSAFRAVYQISNSQPFPEVSLSPLCDASNLLCVNLDPVTRWPDTDTTVGCKATLKVIMNTCEEAKRKE